MDNVYHFHAREPFHVREDAPGAFAWQLDDGQESSLSENREGEQYFHSLAEASLNCVEWQEYYAAIAEGVARGMSFAEARQSVNEHWSGVECHFCGEPATQYIPLGLAMCVNCYEVGFKERPGQS